MEPLVLSISDAATALSIGKTKLYSLISQGVIPAHKLGKRTLLKREDLESYISSLDTYPSENQEV